MGLLGKPTIFRVAPLYDCLEDAAFDEFIGGFHKGIWAESKPPGPKPPIYQYSEAPNFLTPNKITQTNIPDQKNIDYPRKKISAKKK